MAVSPACPAPCWSTCTIAALACHSGRGPGSIHRGSFPLPSSHLISTTRKSQSQRVEIFSTPRYRGMKAHEWGNQAKSRTSEGGWMPEPDSSIATHRMGVAQDTSSAPARDSTTAKPQRALVARGACSHRRCSGLANRGHRGLSTAAAAAADIHFATGGREGHGEGSRVAQGHSTEHSRF